MHYYLLKEFIATLLIILTAGAVDLKAIPIQIAHHVPYARLSSFCSEKREPGSIGLVDAVVLLDTGSDKFWLADHQCSGCKHTQSFCPHISDSEFAMGYYRGHVEGSYSFAKICEKRIKFFCVRGASEMQQLGGEGILGLRKQSNSSLGYSLLFERTEQSAISSDKFSNLVTFYYGQYENFIFLHSSNRKQYHPILNLEQNAQQIPCDVNWSFPISYIEFFQQKLPYLNEGDSLVASVDTGSSKIVFPMQICKQLIQVIKDKFRNVCSYSAKGNTGQGIYCSRSIEQFSFSIAGINRDKFTIDDDYLISKQTNKINVLCYISKKDQGWTQNKIILGYPLLKSFQVSFSAQTTEQKTNFSIFLRPYSQEVFSKQKQNLRLALIGYTLGVGFLAWVTQSMWSYVQDKRSKKIII